VIRSALRTWRFIRSHPIGSRSLRASLSRWIRWQVVSRTLPYPIVTPFANGTSLVVEPGMTGATGNVYVGLHEFADMALVLHFLRPEDLFVDIGANVGSYTILASGAIGARTISFEPVPTTFARLQRNIRYNQLEGKVEAHRTAIGAAPGEILFTADTDTTNQVAPPNYTGATVRVPVNSADELLRSDANPSVQMWKVDVEGYESEVLRGAEMSLANPHLKVVLLEGGSPEIVATMQRHGFQPAVYEAFTRKLLLAERAEHSGNYLWIRDPEFVAERVRTAPEFQVLEHVV
jgi:FkbM family methyltransferase